MIAIASDHAGFALKEKLKLHFKENNIEFIDLGTDSEQSCHYPVFAKKLCKKFRTANVTKVFSSAERASA